MKIGLLDKGATEKSFDSPWSNKSYLLGSPKFNCFHTKSEEAINMISVKMSDENSLDLTWPNSRFDELTDCSFPTIKQ